jgi:hypothetical protein
VRYTNRPPERFSQLRDDLSEARVRRAAVDDQDASAESPAAVILDEAVQGDGVLGGKARR